METKTDYSINLETIKDEALKSFIIGLINTLEESLQQIKTCQTQIQELKDEVNRLKGEQGKPDIKAGKKKRLN
jgi:hypothetical protein